MAVEAAVAIVLALQFAAFGWRINREITVGDQGRKTWLPVADYLNIIMLLATVGACVVWPLVDGKLGAISKAVLVGALVLIAFHPVTTAGHYGLIVARSRNRYLKENGDYRYCTTEEALFFALSIALAVVAALAVL